MICSRCGNDRPAVLHEPAVVDGVSTSRAYCTECVEALLGGVAGRIVAAAPATPPLDARERFERLVEHIGIWGTRAERLARLREVLESYEHAYPAEECTAAAAALERPRRRWWGDPPPEFVRAFVEKFRPR